MSNSLLLDDLELLPTDPAAVGSHLLLEYDLGDPAIVTAAVEALLLDGEQITPVRSGNRSFVLPVLVRGDSRLDLSARVDGLAAMVAAGGFTLTWSPHDGLPIVWDCFAGQVDVQWNLRSEGKFVQQVHVTIPALPFGRSPDAVTPTLTEAATSTNTALFTLSDLIGSARAPLGAELSFEGPVDAWLLHRPPVDADPAAPIVNTITDGTAAVSDAELLRGTYTVVLGIITYGEPGQPRVVTVTVAQDGTDVAQTISKAYISSLNLRQLDVGNVTLPLVDRPVGAASALTVTVDDSGGSTFHTVLLIDTRGQTVQSMAQTDGVDGTVSAYVDEPDVGAVVGPVWNSPTGSRADAYAATEPRISGGALTLSAADEGGALLVYSAGFDPELPVLGYSPRWLAERVE